MRGLVCAVVSYVVSSISFTLTCSVRSQNFWVKDHRQIYLLGNPMVWWFSTAAVFAYMVTRGILILRAQRGYKDFEDCTYKPFLLRTV